MQQRAHPIASAFAGWRYPATLLLLIVTIPIFLGAALVAALVVLPIALLIGGFGAWQKVLALSATQRHILLR